jgi:ribosomal protein S27E
MNNELTITDPSNQRLKCSQCGNEDYFVEVMEHVENLVNGKLYTIRQLMGIPDRYYCKQCGNLAAVWGH